MKSRFRSKYKCFDYVNSGMKPFGCAPFSMYFFKKPPSLSLLVFTSVLAWGTAPLHSATPSLAGVERLFHLDLDHSFNAVEAAGRAEALDVGQAPPRVEGIAGQAALFEKGRVLAYSAADNLNKTEGTLSFWFQAPSASYSTGGPWTLFREDGPDRAGSTALKVELFPGRFLRVSIQDPKNAQMFFREVKAWTEKDWHHVAVTWNANKGSFLYVDGEPVATGWMPAWKPQHFERFLVGAGSSDGKNAARVALDELSIYDRELTASEVRETYAAHRTFRADVRVLDPFVPAGETNSLKVAVHNPGDEAMEIADVRFVLRDEAGAEVQTGQLSDQSVQGQAVEWVNVSLEAAPAGDYQLQVSYLEGGERRDVQSTVVFFEKRESPEPRDAEMTLLLEVNAATQEPVAEVGGTQVVDSPLGAYREGGDRATNRFAMDFMVEDVNEPHVAVIRYPDDKSRSMEIMLQDFGDPLDFQVHSGVFTGEEYPTTCGMQEYRAVFWPRTARQAFTFMTAEDGYPAAVHDIKIYRLHSFGVSSRQGEYTGSEQARSSGLYYEDPVLFHSFGTGQDRDSFMLATDRLVHYMRSFGQTEFEYPLVWYGGALYGTTVEAFEPDIDGGQGGVRPHPPGFPVYLLKRLAENGIKFTAGLHSHTFPSLNPYAITDWERIGQGEDTVININKEGKLRYGYWHGADPNYNAADPRVMEAVNQTVDEIAQRYGHEPAFDGISLVIAKHKLYSFGSIASGYNDSNLERFQKTSGIEIPVYNRGDPERFRRSYEWLMANPEAKKAWIDWRCEVLYAHYAAMADRLAEVRSDLKLKINLFVHLTHNDRLADYLNEPPVEVMREMGIDPALYGDHPNIVFNYTSVPAELRWARNHGYAIPDLDFRTVMTAPEVMESFADQGNLRMTIHDRYFESAIGREEPLEGLTKLGVEEMVWRASTLNPWGFHALEPYMFAVNYLDATSVVKGGYVIGTFGMETELEEFGRAFHALPAVRFDDVAGASDPLRVRQQVVDGKLYVYLLNTLPVPVEASVTVNGPGTLKEPATGEQHQIGADGWHVSLAPYALRTFVSDLGEQRVTGADVNVPEYWLNGLKADYNRLMQAAERQSSKATAYAPYLALAQRSWDAGHYSRLYFLLQEHWASDLLEK